MGEGLGVFLAHPAFQELGAYLEVRGHRARARTRTSSQAARAARPLDEAACAAEPPHVSV